MASIFDNIDQEQNDLQRGKASIFDQNTTQQQSGGSIFDGYQPAQTQQDVSFADQIGKGFASGNLGVIQGELGLGKVMLGTDGSMLNAVQQKMQDYNRAREWSINEMIDNPLEYIKNPSGLAYGVANQLGSSAQMMVQGALLMKALPAAAVMGVANMLGKGSSLLKTASFGKLGNQFAGKTGAEIMSTDLGKMAVADQFGHLLEALSEGGSSGQQDLEEGKDEWTARASATKNTLLNMLILNASGTLETNALADAIKSFGKKGAGTAGTLATDWLINALQQGAEEGLQNQSDLAARGQAGYTDIVNPFAWTDESKQQTLEAFGGSLVTGPLMAGAGKIYSGKQADTEQAKAEEKTASPHIDFLQQYKTDDSELQKQIDDALGGFIPDEQRIALAKQLGWNGETVEQAEQPQIQNIRYTPIADGIEDKDLANTNPMLKRGVDNLNTWVYQQFGKDMLVSGGARSKEHNREVNGDSNSHHLRGNAVDIDLSNFTDEERQAIQEQAKAMGFNSDGEDMYHDRGTGYHMHLIPPTDGKFKGPSYGNNDSSFADLESQSAGINLYIQELEKALEENNKEIERINQLGADATAEDLMAYRAIDNENKAISNRLAQNTDFMEEITTEQDSRDFDIENADEQEITARAAFHGRQTAHLTKAAQNVISKLSQEQKKLNELRTGKKKVKNSEEAISESQDKIDELIKERDEILDKLKVHSERNNALKQRIQPKQKVPQQEVKPQFPKAQADDYQKSIVDNQVAQVNNMSDNELVKLAQTTPNEKVKQAVGLELQRREITAGNNFTVGDKEANIAPYQPGRKPQGTYTEEQLAGVSNLSNEQLTQVAQRYRNFDNNDRMKQAIGLELSKRGIPVGEGFNVERSANLAPRQKGTIGTQSNQGENPFKAQFPSQEHNRDYKNGIIQKYKGNFATFQRDYFAGVNAIKYRENSGEISHDTAKAYVDQMRKLYDEVKEPIRNNGVIIQNGKKPEAPKTEPKDDFPTMYRGQYKGDDKGIASMISERRKVLKLAGDQKASHVLLGNNNRNISLSPIVRRELDNIRVARMQNADAQTKAALYNDMLKEQEEYIREVYPNEEVKSRSKGCDVEREEVIKSLAELEPIAKIIEKLKEGYGNGVTNRYVEKGTSIEADVSDLKGKEELKKGSASFDHQFFSNNDEWYQKWAKDNNYRQPKLRDLVEIAVNMYTGRDAYGDRLHTESYGGIYNDGRSETYKAMREAEADVEYQETLIRVYDELEDKFKAEEAKEIEAPKETPVAQAEENVAKTKEDVAEKQGKDGEQPKETVVEQTEAPVGEENSKPKETVATEEKPAQNEPQNAEEVPIKEGVAPHVDKKFENTWLESYQRNYSSPVNAAKRAMTLKAVDGSLKVINDAYANVPDVIGPNNDIIVSDETKNEIKGYYESAKAELEELRANLEKEINNIKENADIKDNEDNTKQAENKTESTETNKRFNGERAKSALKAKIGKKKGESKEFKGVFDESKEDEIIKRLKSKMNRLNSMPMFDPEFMSDAFYLGGIYIQKGVRNFAKWSSKMTDVLGEKIKPFLSATWDTLQSYDNSKGAVDNEIMADVMEFVGAAIDQGKTKQQIIDEFKDDYDEAYLHYVESAYKGLQKYPTDIKENVVKSNENTTKEDEKNATDNGRLQGISQNETSAGLQTNEERGDSGNIREAENRGNDGEVLRTPRLLQGDSTETDNGRPDGSNKVRERDTVQSEGPSESRTVRTGVKEELAPAQKKNAKPKEVSGHNFTITEDDKIGDGGPKAKFRDNINAIKLLKKLEEEGRLATPEEQKVLARYVGWGGLADAFAYNPKPEWKAEAQELKELLSPEDYRKAQNTVNDAFYTPTGVIKGIWDVLERMGFKGGKVLEPSMGVGNFFGLMPESMRNKSTLNGIEFDSLTGRIAKQLYQKANIEVAGYEDIKHPNDFFDLIISNVPFGYSKPKDGVYDKLGLDIHNYFFMKSIDKVRPGGIVAFITTTGTMQDNADSVRLRKILSSKADLIGAIRLPDTTFAKNAGTSVVSDLIILQKREEGAKPSKNNKAWLETVDTEFDKVPNYPGAGKLKINEYFANNPNMVIGTLERGDYRGNLVVNGKGLDVANELQKRLETFPKNIYKPLTGKRNLDSVESAKATFLAPAQTRQGAFLMKDGKAYSNEQGNMVEIDSKNQEKAVAYIKVRDAAKQILADQLKNDVSEETLQKERDDLNKAYDSFVAKHGYLHQSKNKALTSDPDFGIILSIEQYDVNKETKKITAGKKDIFFKRTVNAIQETTNADNASDALALSLNNLGTVDLEYMSKLTGKTQKQLLKDLDGYIFQDPKSNLYETAEEYLSGNVREKLEYAQEAAKNDSAYEKNVEALKKVQPKNLVAEEISVGLGTPWIPSKDIEAFAAHMLDRYNALEIKFNSALGSWTVGYGRWGKSFVQTSTENTSKWGTTRKTFTELLDDILNQRTIQVYDRTEDNKSVLNQKETNVAQQKAKEIQAKFKEWIFSDGERRERLVNYYNHNFNNWKLREYDGSHLQLPGYSSVAPSLREHQKDAVWRIMQGNTLLAHCVGAGKTWTMQTAAMEMKRLGMARKSMFVIPNHMLGQFEEEFRIIYPNAKLLVISSDRLPDVAVPGGEKMKPAELAKKKAEKNAKRQEILGRIATEDWDGIIISHNMFKRIPMSPTAYQNYYAQQKEELEQALVELAADQGSSGKKVVKDIQKKLDKLEEKLKENVKEQEKDIVIPFEQLGIDQIFVDEADMFKNLGFATKMSRVSGLSTTASQRSEDMFIKTQYLTTTHNGRGVCFATGTPISNTMAEMFTMMRYMDTQNLKEHNMNFFDNWAANFAVKETAVERKPDGNGYRTVEKFTKFTNMPELIKMFRKFTDVKTQEELNLNVPELVNGKPTVIEIEPNEALTEFIKNDIKERSQAIKNGMVDPSVDNMLKLTSDLRKASLDMRLVNPSIPAAGANAKLVAVVDNAYKKYVEFNDTKGAQLIFCDLSAPKASSDKVNESDTEAKESGEETENITVYEEIAKMLQKKGVPQSEIAFIHDAKNKDQKEALFARVRNGQVRFLLGSTEKMGAGTNVQKNLVALHDVDAPWRPRDIEQRHGRIIRQGNQNKVVEIFNYVTKGSFDANMWEKLKNKATMISQAMSNNLSGRTIEDVDANVVSFGEIEALASDNPLMAERVMVSAELNKYEALRDNYVRNKEYARRELQRKPALINALETRLDKAKADLKQRKDISGDNFSMQVGTRTFIQRKEAQAAIDSAIKNVEKNQLPVTKVGKIGGFDIEAKFVKAGQDYRTEGSLFALRAAEDTVLLTLKGNNEYELKPSLQSIEHTVMHEPDKVADGLKAQIANAKKEQKSLREEAEKPFEYEKKYQEVKARAEEIDKLLEIGKEEQQSTTENSNDENVSYSVTNAQIDATTKVAVVDVSKFEKANITGNANKMAIINGLHGIPFKIKGSNGIGRVEPITGKEKDHFVNSSKKDKKDRLNTTRLKALSDIKEVLNNAVYTEKYKDVKGTDAMFVDCYVAVWNGQDLTRFLIVGKETKGDPNSFEVEEVTYYDFYKKTGAFPESATHHDSGKGQTRKAPVDISISDLLDGVNGRDGKPYVNADGTLNYHSDLTRNNSSASSQANTRSKEDILNELSKLNNLGKVEMNGDKVIITLPNGNKINFSVVKNEFTVEQMAEAAKTHNLKGPVNIGGRYYTKVNKNGVDTFIEVVENSGQAGDTYHELWHFVQDFTLKAKEKAGIAKAVKDRVKKTGKTEREAEADLMRDAVLNRQKQKDTLWGRLLLKMWDFAKRLQAFLTDNENLHNVARKFEEGEMFNRRSTSIPNNDNVSYSASERSNETTAIKDNTISVTDLKRSAEKIVPLKASKEYRHIENAYDGHAKVGLIHNNGDVTTLAGIVGMHLDRQFKLFSLKSNGQAKNESTQEILDKATENAQSSLEPAELTRFNRLNNLEKYKRGVAAFMRMYVRNPQKAQTEYPVYFNEFTNALDKDKSLKAKVDSFIRDCNSYEGLTEEGKARAGISKPKPSEQMTIKERVQDVWHRVIYPQLFDDKDPIHRAVLKVEEITGKAIAAIDNPYIQARIATSSASNRINALVKGVEPGKTEEETKARREAIWKEMCRGIQVTYTDENGNEVTKCPLSKKAIFFSDIIDKASELDKKMEGNSDEAQRLQNYLTNHGFKDWTSALGTYLLANRHLEIWKTKPNYVGTMSKAEAERMVKYVPQEIRDAAQLYYAFDKNLLGYMWANGLLSKEAYDNLNKYEAYCPLFRDFADEQAYDKYFNRIANMNSAINISNGIKYLTETGSDRTVLDDPMVSMLRMTGAILGKCENNKVGQKFVAMSKHSGIGEFIMPEYDAEGKQKTTANPQESVFTVYENGEKKAYRTTPELYEVLNGNGEQATAMFAVMESIAGMTASTLRKGATISPGFVLRNIIRDNTSAWINSKNGYIPVVDWIRGWNALGNDELRARFDISGASMASYYRQDQKGLMATMDEMAGHDKHWYDKNYFTSKMGKMISWLWGKWMNIGERAENATRMGEWLKAIENGKSDIEAAYDAKEATLDFSRAGKFGRHINRVIPFWNAVMQGNDKAIRTVRDNPSRAMVTLGGMMLASIAYWSLVHDDDWWKELENDDKYASVHIPFVENGKQKHITIPLPQEYGLATWGASIAALEQMNKENPKAMQDFSFKMLWDLTPGFIPTLIRPLLEVVTNYDLYFRSPVEGKKYQNLTSEARYNAYTSAPSKFIGSTAPAKALGLSPLKVEHLIRGYTGGAGIFLARAIPQEDKTPAKYWSEYPFVGDFIKTDFEHSKSLSDWYDLKTNLDQYHATNDKGYTPGYITGANKINSEIAKIRKQITAVRNANPEALAPERKRQIIDNLNLRVMELAQIGLKNYRKYEH